MRALQLFGGLAIGLAFFLTTSGAASAQTQDQQWAYCKDDGEVYVPDLQIGGCTALIQSGTLTAENLAIVFVDRGITYLPHAGLRPGDYRLRSGDPALPELC